MIDQAQHVSLQSLSSSVPVWSPQQRYTDIAAHVLHSYHSLLLTRERVQPGFPFQQLCILCQAFAMVCEAWQALRSCTRLRYAVQSC